jgi:hypothetical protein
LPTSGPTLRVGRTAEADPSGFQGTCSTPSSGCSTPTPPRAPPARALPALPDLPPSLPAVERERALDEILRASAEDLKGRGGFELSECFVDGTFVGTRKGADRWNRTSGTTSSWHGTHGAGRPLWSSYWPGHETLLRALWEQANDLAAFEVH